LPGLIKGITPWAICSSRRVTNERMVRKTSSCGHWDHPAGAKHGHGSYR
jgi:hypothetical protein